MQELQNPGPLFVDAENRKVQISLYGQPFVLGRADICRAAAENLRRGAKRRESPLFNSLGGFFTPSGAPPVFFSVTRASNEAELR